MTGGRLARRIDDRPKISGAGRGLRSIHGAIAEYYTDKVTAFGPTPFGADWTCVATQEMRFVQLLKLCDFAAPFTLNDLGCGYGALLAFLDRRHGACAVDYLGIDLSAAMLRHARQTYRAHRSARFVAGHDCPRVADYSVASGIFNVCLEQPREAWEAHVEATLDQLASTSRRGFAVNFVAMRPAAVAGLFTTGPERWVTYCARRFDTETEVIAGYGLAEFTLLVRHRLGA
jgi:SAM-dependent methyltransferase